MALVLTLFPLPFLPDMEVANKVVELTHQYPDVFPPGA